MAGIPTLGLAISHDEIAALLERCNQKPADMYTAKEQEFLGGVQPWQPLSSAQADWLRALADRQRIDFDKVNSAALAVFSTLLQRWLPDGKMYGKEYVALNPLRSDHRAGSFRINMLTGRWSDFAAGDNAKGGDPISLAAYLHHGGDQLAAARALAGMFSL